MSTASVTVKHNFETAHRLYFLGGKCANLHGHSWNAEVTIWGDPDEDGLLIDFGLAKAHIRQWIDAHLDHGTMLGADDPLLPALVEDGGKLFVFEPRATDGPSAYCRGGRGYYDRRPLPWPTVENTAELLRRVVIDLVPGAELVDVTVSETAVNAATARTVVLA